MSDKPVILFFQFDLMAHFFRSLRLAKYLKVDFEVYMRHTDKYADRLEKTGIKTFKCTDYHPETAIEKLANYDFSWLNRHEMEAIFLEQVKAINTYKPNLVIGDTSFTLKMAADATNVPYISILNGYFTRYYALPRKLSPTHYIYKYIHWMPEAVLNPIVKYKEAQNFNLILKEFNGLRNQYNLRNTAHYLEELEGDHSIICDLPEIFPQKKLPAHFHFIGPLFNGNEPEEAFDRSRLSPGKKTILVTAGSSGNWHNFKFLNHDLFSSYNIIVAGTGNSVLNAPFLIKAPFISFNDINSLVDLVICHGGNGTIYNALVNNMPCLCLPSHPEQFWNAQRIEELGYGESLFNIKPDQYQIIIDKWIERKNNMDMNLNFDAFNDNFQNNLISEIVKGLI
jgi:UDP:flavonoid glycosyltransferase YjiC (YdhE family)